VAVTPTAGISIGSTTTNATATRISELATATDRTTAASVYELCNEIYNCSYQKPKICDINVVSGDNDACEVRVGMVAEPTGYTTLISSDETVKTNGRSKNPFLASDCSANGKRDEFLKATMKICLVVSPPSNRLQVSVIVVVGFTPTPTVDDSRQLAGNSVFITVVNIIT
jgi:hypothetical protein